MIKKCYDALNDFYRNRTMSGKIDVNPMLTVEMLNKENIIKAPKEIEFFENDDIKKFPPVRLNIGIIGQKNSIYIPCNTL